MQKECSGYFADLLDVGSGKKILCFVSDGNDISTILELVNHLGYSAEATIGKMVVISIESEEK